MKLFIKTMLKKLHFQLEWTSQQLQAKETHNNSLQNITRKVSIDGKIYIFVVII